MTASGLSAKKEEIKQEMNLKALLKTVDPLMVSFVLDLLEKEGVKAFEFDQNFSVMDGSIGIIPRRIMVVDEELEKARELLRGAGLGHELELKS